MLNKLREFAFDANKQNLSQKNIGESVFGIKAQTKTMGVQERRESFFDIGIIHDLSRLDRPGESIRDMMQFQNKRGVSSVVEKDNCTSNPCVHGGVIRLQDT